MVLIVLKLLGLIVGWAFCYMGYRLFLMEKQNAGSNLTFLGVAAVGFATVGAIIAIISVLQTSGSAPPPPPEASPTPAPTATSNTQLTPASDDPRVMSVLFATNRVLKLNNARQFPIFSSERSPYLTFGTAAVRVPDNHHQGELKRPGLDLVLLLGFFIVKTEAERPADHFILTDLRVESEEDFVRAINDSGATSALLFVHGFNTSF
jgi:hypothetical protein